MSSPPEVRVSVDTVYIDPGQVLTVWLRPTNREHEQAQQVELRVLPDGTPEVWAKSEIVRDWNLGWEPMRRGEDA